MKTVARLPSAGRSRSRVGTQVLKRLAQPLTCPILRSLGKRPMRLADLQEGVGGAPQSTLRVRLSELAEIGATAKRGGGMPYAVKTELTDEGRELLRVAEVFAGWLARCPEVPMPLGSGAARNAIKALAGGWESTMLRALAARPLSLTEMNSLITGLSYPALERRLTAMKTAGLVEAMPEGVQTPYEITRWGREAIGPLAAAIRFERMHMADGSAPPRTIDVEAAFLLATPIARLSARVDGACQLAAQTSGQPPQVAGVKVVVDRGRLVECVARVDPNPRTWALGEDVAWLDALVDRHSAELRTGGDEGLIHDLLLGIHDGVFEGESSHRRSAPCASSKARKRSFQSFPAKTGVTRN